MFQAIDLFDLAQTEHAAIFDGCSFAWEALRKIHDHTMAHLKAHGGGSRYQGPAEVGENVLIGEGTVIEPGAMIKGPAIIGRNCQIRHNAYIREDVIVGDNCVIGNSCELKNSLIFNQCQVPHFNYVGDSILGHKAHLGAGVKISNIKIVPGNVTMDKDGVPYDTGLRKFGALIGDEADIGCNAVLNPGSIIGRGAWIYPNVTWRGILPAHMIAKNKCMVDVVMRRPRQT